MRPIQFEKFKIYEENINQDDYFNKLVDERAMFEVFPHLVDYEVLEMMEDDIPAYAKGNIIGKDGTLMRHFERTAKVHNTDKHYIIWRLKTGEGDMRSTFLENVNDQYATKLGARGAIFKIKTDVDWYSKRNTLMIEGLREVPLLVVSEPMPHGQGYVYQVQLLVDNDNIYITPEDISPGTKMMQHGSLIGEAQSDRGAIHFGAGEAYVEFEIPLTRMGWEMEVTDDAHMASKNFRISQVTDSGKKYAQQPDILYNSLEMKFNSTVNYQKDLWLTYGRAASNYGGKFLDMTTARPFKTGPGLFEFLESSFTYDYPIEGGSIDLIADFLQAAWTDRVPHTQRNIRIAGGTGFLRVWERWCRKADQYGIIQTEEYNYSDEEPLYPGRKGVGVGRKQYRSIWLEPFGKITVDYWPFLDSEKVETRKYRGLSIQSYQAIITDYGYGTGPSSNVYLVKNPQREQYGYSIGTWSPMGPVLGRPEVGSRFHNGLGTKNAFKYIHESEFGMLIKDPSYMLWLRPDFV